MGCRGAQSERGSGVRRLLLAQARQCRSGAQCAGSAPAVGGPVGRDDTGPPLVVGGIVADVVGLSLQLVALHLGALAVVQPLLVSGLLFALILRQRTRRYTRHREIGWALLLTLCLAGFLLLAGTAHQPVSNEPADRVPAAAAAVIGVVLAIGCVLLGRRQSPGGRSAALLGVAVGTIYAATAALLKALTGIALHGPVALFTSWQLYAVVVAGAGGLLLNQLAFQAGPVGGQPARHLHRGPSVEHRPRCHHLRRADPPRTDRRGGPGRSAPGPGCRDDPPGPRRDCGPDLIRARWLTVSWPVPFTVGRGAETAAPGRGAGIRRRRGSRRAPR